MNTVADGCVVEMHYTLTNKAGEQIDSSKGSKPLAYTQGNMDIVPGLEKEMACKKVGEKFTVTVSPEEGYGLSDKSLIQAVPKHQFGNDTSQIKVGMQFQISKPDGQGLLVTVVEVRDEDIVLDGNHPLADETLYFDIEIVQVRKATEKELNKAAASSCCHDPDCDK